MGEAGPEPPCDGADGRCGPRGPRGWGERGQRLPHGGDPSGGPRLAMQLLGVKPNGARQLWVRRVSQDRFLFACRKSRGGFTEMLSPGEDCCGSVGMTEMFKHQRAPSPGVGDPARRGVPGSLPIYLSPAREEAKRSGCCRAFPAPKRCSSARAAKSVPTERCPGAPQICCGPTRVGPRLRRLHRTVIQ